jgi:hypothetical protein
MLRDLRLSLRLLKKNPTTNPSDKAARRATRVAPLNALRYE